MSQPVLVDTKESNSVGAATHAAIQQVNQSLKPEWLRILEAVRIFGVCRSTLYEWIAEGKIKSVCLHKRGAQRGIRLLSFDSLSELIERAASEEGLRK